MLLRWLSRLYYRVIGWKADDPLPMGLRKCVVVAAPHTSNLDFPIGIAAVYIYGVKITYLAKKEVFRFPFRFIFHGTGGIPLDRSRRSDTVRQSAALFRDAEALLFVLAPESTRRAVKYWKTGFYYIALEAKVPVVLGFIDYKRKRAGFGKVVHPTGDVEKDMGIIRDYYRGMGARNPEKFDPDAIVAGERRP